MASVTKENVRRWWQWEALVIWSTSERPKPALLANVEIALPPSPV